MSVIRSVLTTLLSAGVIFAMPNLALSSPIIGVHFGSNGAAPTNWTLINTIAAPFSLTDETGATSAVHLIWSAPTNESLFAGTLNAGTVPIHTPSLASLNGNLDGFQGPFTATFRDLAPNQDYDVWVFGARFGTALTQTVTVTGDGTPTVFTQAETPNDLFVNGSIGSSTSTLDSEALAVQSAADGTISISIVGTDPTQAWDVAGLAIREQDTQNTPVPEPTSLLLLGTGLIGAGLRRYRRS